MKENKIQGGNKNEKWLLPVLDPISEAMIRHVDNSVENLNSSNSTYM